mgnify:CR=1 FL=1
MSIDTAYWGNYVTSRFDFVSDDQKPRVEKFLSELPSMSDRDYLNSTSLAIRSAVLMARRPSSDAEDCMVAACYAESVKRHMRDGHSENCYAPGLYDRAYRNVVPEHSREAERMACTCGATA